MPEMTSDEMLEEAKEKTADLLTEICKLQSVKIIENILASSYLRGKQDGIAVAQEVYKK